jgi:D-alanyl-D-alanine carboxypeptidase/D-alanyl-D-alanine-endopeptidase (penicillin-binding protein 4)
MLTTLIALAATTQSALASAVSNPALKGALAGVCVTRLDGRVVFSRLADTRLIPASNQKLLTAVYAASTLGMGFQPKTRFWRTDEGIYVDAPGDPNLTKSQLLQARTALGIADGTRIFVRQAYAPSVPPGWEHDDLPHRYAARVTALSFDRGGFEIWSKDGGLAPLDPAYRIKLEYTWTPESAKVDYGPDERTAKVTGTIPSADKMIEAFAMPDPDVTAALVLGGELIKAQGPPPEREPDFVITGQKLAETLKTCLEKSDNNMAEQLLLMAASKSGPLGDDAYKSGAERMQAFLLKTARLVGGSVHPADGSGMSRHNLVTPSAMCRLLRWAHRQPWRDQFLVALAAPGEGTLESRMKSSSFLGKTGTLSAVTCLSGYVKTRSGQTLVVSMLFNNTVAPASEVRAVQDRVVTILERDSK